MECSESGAIRDEELLAYIDGAQVRPAVVAHISHCQHCSSQLATYQRVDRKLIQRLYRWDCPTNQVLGEYQLGLLSSGQAAGVQDHLRRCVLCAAEVAMLTNFLANDPLLVRLEGGVGAGLAPAPAPTTQHVLNHSHISHAVRNARHVLEEWYTEGIASTRRVVATLLSSQPRLAYQRDISDATAQWPRRYSAEGLTISLQVERTPQHAHQRASLQLIGFVTSDGGALEELQGISVSLLSQTKVGDGNAQAVHSQTIDDLGNFLFSALEPDTYMLEFQLPQRVVAIEQILLTM
jgi:anti-sigma factor RsiW